MEIAKVSDMLTVIAAMNGVGYDIWALPRQTQGRVSLVRVHAIYLENRPVNHLKSGILAWTEILGSRPRFCEDFDHFSYPPLTI